MSVYTSTSNELCCPLCGDVFVHVDQAQVAARTAGEDGPIKEIGVTAAGDISDETGNVPVGARVGVGRRHRIALLGWCESCSGKFALVFTQFKGVTFVESVEMPGVDGDIAELPVQRDEEPQLGSEVKR